jgi:cell division septation protein DedD
MSMADDSRLRSYRSNDPYRRAVEPAPSSQEAGARDPLAELARLLGQSDPFAELGRSNSRPREAQNAPTTAPADWRSAPARQSQFAAADSIRPRAQPPSPDYADSPAPERRSFDDPVYDEPRSSAEQGAYYDADQSAHHGAQQDAYYGVEPPQPSEAGYDPEYYADEAPLDPQDEAMYDDAPRARRGGNLATVLTLVGCAVFGTAGAYAFRTYYTSPGATQAPPVITADTSTPTKIVPAGDPQASKTVQDRVANAEREQVVSKQEEPVTLKDLANQAAPPNQAAPRGLPAPVASGQGASQPAAGTASRSDEPKKVRTVTIRPDGGDMSGKPVTSQAASAAQAALAQPPVAKAAPARSSGPISLDPQSEAPAAAATRTRTAAAPPAPARAAPDATESAGEGFMVQLSSQKSEAEAQSSFRSLQAKFSNELSGLQPVIRRADLGSKGVFYRTMVGPFASAQEAGQFCANYKAAGGQCVVPNN